MRKNNQQMRLLEIDRRLRKTPEPSFEDLASLPYCTSFDEKTLRRDLKDLVDLGAPIRKRRQGNRVLYAYADPSWKLQKLSVSTSDILYLTLARQAVSQFTNPLVVRKFNQMLDQLETEVSEGIDFSREEIERAVTFDPPPTQPVDTSIWNMILFAVLKRQAVEVLYKSNSSQKPAWRKMLPYHLVCLEGDWFILAGSPSRAAARQYNLARVIEIRSTRETFKVPPDFDARELLDSTFGRFISMGRKETVRIRVDARMAPYVRNRTWHARQTIREMDDGSLEIAFPVSADGPSPFGNVASWVLGLGASVVVLEPPALREQVCRDAACVLKHYT